MSLVEREGSNVHPCAEMLNDGGRRVPVGENGPGKRSMGVGRKEGVWMDGRLRQLRESVSKASAPKLNQRQPPRRYVSNADPLLTQRRGVALSADDAITLNC